jgi:hypothetical protein
MPNCFSPPMQRPQHNIAINIVPQRYVTKETPCPQPATSRSS